MFLTELNEREKKNFLELAHYIMKVDDTVDVEGVVTFDNLRAELRLSKSDYQVTGKEFRKVLIEFNQSKKRIRRLILIELFGLIFVKEQYQAKEAEVVEQIVDLWNFRDYEVRKVRRWVQDFNDLLREAYMFIDNEE